MKTRDQRVEYKAPDEAIVLLGDVDQFTLLGLNDINLRLLQKTVQGTISVRGEKLWIKCSAPQLEPMVDTILGLLDLLEREKTLDEVTVRYVLDRCFAEGEIEQSGWDPQGEVLYFAQGKRRAIRTRTSGQQAYVEAVREHDIVFAIGPAGTGKTYLAVVMAMDYLRRGLVERIVLVRPAVEAGEQLGFLPGDLQEKIDPYLRPLYDALADTIGPGQIQRHMASGVIEAAPLGYMRGRTLNNSFVILDEAQNTTRGQMKMFLTRLGIESKAIVTGDITQIDLIGKEGSGLVQARDILVGTPGIAFVELLDVDVVRHPLVRRIIEAFRTAEEKQD